MAPKKKATPKTPKAAKPAKAEAAVTEENPLNLFTLFTTLKTAIENRDWRAVLSICADLIKQFTAPTPMTATPGETGDVGAAVADIEAAVASAKNDTAATTANAPGAVGAPAVGAISPDLVMQLVVIAIEIWKNWKK